MQTENQPHGANASAAVRSSQTADVAAGAANAQIAQQINSPGATINFRGKRLLQAVKLAAGANLQRDTQQDAQPKALSGLQWLMPENRATALVGRENELASLRLWLEAPRPTLLRCITGDGGRGKTRLGIEACELAISLGFAAGFVRGETLNAIASVDGWAELDLSHPSLIVIDYAAGRAQAIGAWLGALLEADRNAAPKLRILLLERHASTAHGWYNELFTGGYSSYGKRELFSPFEPLELPGLHTAAERRAVLQGLHAQLPAQHRANALPTGESFDAALAANPDAGDPLWLMMLAFALDSLTAPDAAASRTRQDLALALARQHEAPRIAALAKAQSLHPEFAQYLAACVTLLQGCTRSELATIATAEMPHLHITSRGGFDQAALQATALGEAGSEGEPTIQPIGPDLIGEAFVLHVLNGTFRDQASTALLRLQKCKPANVSQSVVRTAQDFGRMGAGACSLSWLSHLVEEVEANSAALAALAVAIPLGSAILRPINLRVAIRLVGTLSNEDDGAKRATALSNLSICQGEMGQFEAALLTAREVVRSYRLLAEDRPDRFRADLASSLSNLVGYLSACGQHIDALTAGQEAVDLCREEAKLGGIQSIRDLAMSLSNLAGPLSRVGQRSKALNAAQEAANLNRRLVEEVAGEPTADLARSLINLATRLDAMGFRRAALEAARESVTLRRALAKYNPDLYRSDLALSLHNLAVTCNSSADLGAGLDAANEAVGLYRNLALHQPTSFTPSLAGSLIVLAVYTQDLGGAQASLVACQLAAEAIEKLTPYFAALPQAHAGLMAGAVREYRGFCEAAGVEPSAQLLDPLVPVFVRLQTER